MKKCLVVCLICLCSLSAYAKDITVHHTLQINTDSELLMSHEYYKGVKVKSIKIKQVEINNDSYITNGKVIEGDPNSIGIVVEITDIKGNKTELYGFSNLSKGDYTYFVSSDEKK